VEIESENDQPSAVEPTATHVVHVVPNFDAVTVDVGSAVSSGAE
jgi:hypothetical protein